MARSELAEKIRRHMTDKTFLDAGATFTVGDLLRDVGGSGVELVEAVSELVGEHVVTSAVMRAPAFRLLTVDDGPADVEDSGSPRDTGGQSK